jgi:hypothetical protein
MENIELLSGCIYKITCLDTNKFYIGSTSNNINKRIAVHKSHYKRFLDGKYNYISSFNILEKNNFKVEVLEEVQFKYKIELLDKEREYIKGPLCVNLNMPNTLLTTRQFNEEIIFNEFRNIKYKTKDEFIFIFNKIINANPEISNKERTEILNNNEMTNKKRIGTLNTMLKNSKYLIKNKQIRNNNERIRIYYIEAK